MLKNLKKIRLERGLSQKAIAEAINVSRSTYSLYEKGCRWPSADILVLLANKLEVSVDFLLGRTEDTTPPQRLSRQEKNHLDRYRQMDERGKHTIDSLIMFEKLRFPAEPEGKKDRSGQA